MEYHIEKELSMERSYPKATITEKGERSLRGGHPWVFADEVTELSGGMSRRRAGGRLFKDYSSLFWRRLTFSWM